MMRAAIGGDMNRFLIWKKTFLFKERLLNIIHQNQLLNY